MQNATQRRWIPVLGEFDISDDTIVFHGKRVPRRVGPEAPSGDPADQVSFGMLISNSRLTDGSISATVELENVTDESACAVVLQYGTNPQQFFSAGLGGPKWAMYSIEELGGEQQSSGWHTHAAGGDRTGLKASQKYDIEFQLFGGYLTLAINGVQVLECIAARNQGVPRQVGLLCRADHKITVTNFSHDALRPRAFVVMQFGDKFDDVYSEVVKEVMKDFAIDRADEITGPGLVIADIVQRIRSAHLVVADITPINANVYFEVGYAMALGKPTILLAEKGTTLPFDVAGFRVLFYDNTIGGKGRLESGLREHLDAILTF